MTDKNNIADGAQEKVTLLRALRGRDIFWTALGMGACASVWGTAMIGVGLYGSGFILAIFLTIVIYLLLATNYSELASTYPHASSFKTYVEEAFGPRVGVVGSFMFLLSFMFGISGEVTFVAHVMEAAFPLIPWRVWVVATTLIFGLIINLLGVVNLSKWETGLVVFILLIAISVFVQGMTGFAYDGSDFSRLTSLFEKGINMSGFFSAFLLAMWMYAGFEVVCPLAEECKNPERDLPRGMLSAIGVMGTSKILFTLGAAVLVSASILQGADSFTALGHAMFGGFGFYIMIAFVYAGCAAVTLSNTGSMPRVIYGMAQGEKNTVPKALNYIHPKYRTPWKAQFTYWGIITTIMVVFGDDLTFLIEIGSFIWILQYILGMIVVLRLRRVKPDVSRPFKVPGPTFKSPLLTWITLIATCAFLILSVVPPFGDPAILFFGGTAILIMLCYSLIVNGMHNRKVSK